VRFSFDITDRSKSVLYISFFLFVVLLKLNVVSGNEIVALSNDSAVFVRHVLSGVGQLGAPSGYPVWLWFVDLFGVPQRIAIEVLYLSAAFFVSFVMAKDLNRFWSSILFLILALSPATYHLFDNALSDPLFLCLGFFALGVSIGLFKKIKSPDKKEWAWSAALGCVLGLMSVTRNEDILLYGWVALFYLLSVLFLGRELLNFRSIKKTFTLFLVSLSLLVVVGESPSAFHFLSKGVWTKTLASMPSHMRMLKNLSKIDSGEEQIKFVSISKRARSAAYEVSPTLLLLKDIIENPDNMYVEASHRVGGVPLGEIGNGWIWHVFNDAAIRTIPEPKTVKSLDDFWLKVDGEIEAAFESGRLNERFVIHPFVAAGVARPFLNVVDGVISAADKSFKFQPFQEDQGFASEVFDEVCNRRSSLVSNGRQSRLKIQGWIFSDSKNDLVLNVQVGVNNTERGVIEWVDTVRKSRPDVDSAFSKELGVEIYSYGFDSEFSYKERSVILLRYVTSSGVFSEKELKDNSIEKIKTDFGSSLYRGIDFFESNRLPAVRVENSYFQDGLLGFGGWGEVKLISSMFVVLSSIFVLALRFYGKLGKALVPGFVGVFVLALIVLRLVFYALINENAWEIEPRYMSPVLGMLIVSVVCFIAVVIDAGRRLINKNSTV
jgi:hypothetical protein